MTRQKKNDKHSNKKKRNQPKTGSATKKASTRRDFFATVRNGAIAAAVVGGGTWFVVDEVMATLGEHDLAKLGNGIPTVVQIHDPQCPLCVALQRQARKALDNFDKGELQYLVANIKSKEGRAFATAHGVPHVTLLLFDAKGKQQQVLSGPNQSGYLTDVFRQHLEKFGNS